MPQSSPAAEPADAEPPPERWEEFLLMLRDHGLPVRVQVKPMMNAADLRKALDRLWPAFEKEVRRRERKAIGDDVVVDRLLPEEEEEE